MIIAGCLACSQQASTPAGHSGGGANMNWVKFGDSAEGAFTLDVPQGWTVKGGLVRMGYSDARVMVDLVSPDGRINVRLREITIPNYAVPNAYHSREGDTVDLGAQAQLTVARYRSGQEYASAYGQLRFEGVCRSLAPEQADPPPFADSSQYEVTPVQASAGQVAYRCESDHGPLVAYAYARTALFNGFWQVPTLASYSAPPDQVPLAKSILQHAAQSFKLEPRWIQYQKQMDQQAVLYQRARQASRWRDISRQVAEFEAKMQSMRNQVNAFEHRQAMQAKQVEDFGNILTGITPTVDPYGNRHDVWSGPKNSYWINGLGQTRNADTSPGPGWQPLTIMK